MISLLELPDEIIETILNQRQNPIAFASCKRFLAIYHRREKLGIYRNSEREILEVVGPFDHLRELEIAAITVVIWNTLVRSCELQSLKTRSKYPPSHMLASTELPLPFPSLTDLKLYYGYSWTVSNCPSLESLRLEQGEYCEILSLLPAHCPSLKSITLFLPLEPQLILPLTAFLHSFCGQLTYLSLPFSGSTRLDLPEHVFDELYHALTAQFPHLEHFYFNLSGGFPDWPEHKKKYEHLLRHTAISIEAISLPDPSRNYSFIQDLPTSMPYLRSLASALHVGNQMRCFSVTDYPRLDSMSVYPPYGVENCAPTLAVFTQSFPFITTLGLIQIKHLTDELFLAISHASSLQILNLSGVERSSCTCGSKTIFSKVTELRLASDRVVSLDIVPILECFPSLKILGCADFHTDWSAVFRGPGEHILTERTSESDMGLTPLLSELEFAGHTKSQTAANILTALSHWPQLRSLTVANYEIPAEQLSFVLQACTKLTSLCLFSTLSSRDCLAVLHMHGQRLRSLQFHYLTEDQDLTDGLLHHLSTQALCYATLEVEDSDGLDIPKDQFLPVQATFR